MSLISVQSLKYSWPDSAKNTLDISAFEVAPGEQVFLKGPSGCGKSTFLSALSGVIDVPAGSIRIAGQDIASLEPSGRDRFRVDHMGIIFQVFNLLPWLSAIDNVILPCRFSKRRLRQTKGDPRSAALRLLGELGLRDQAILEAPAMSLSVGQQQRVAAARALIGGPDVVLADEPTSALDEEARNAFVSLLQSECRAAGAALVFVSHDQRLETQFDRLVEFRDMNNAGAVQC